MRGVREVAAASKQGRERERERSERSINNRRSFFAMRRGKRGSGRRRLRELTRSVVETMEILEEVREKHSGVGGMSRALTKVPSYSHSVSHSDEIYLQGTYFV